MKYRLATRPEVEADILHAVDWYERNASPEVAIEFIQNIRKAFSRIADNPLLFMVRHKRLQVRWVFPDRFPYRIVFVVEGELVTVLCIVHAKRHDRSWLSRK